MQKSVFEKNVKKILSARTYEVYKQNVPSPLAARYQRLSADQLVCIYAYSTNEDKYSFADINLQLRTKKIQPCRWSLICQIQRALPLIDRDYFKEIYYRYVGLSEDGVIENYSPGKISTHDGFTSVSARNENFTGTKCNVLMRIYMTRNSLPPAYIAPITWKPEEEEFLYEAYSHFYVLDVLKSEEGEFEVKLLECKL